jgi:MFS family permease
MYRSARGPAMVMIWTNLFWIVPILMYNPYAQVYAMELGLNKIDLGYISALTMGVQLVFFLVGGWLTDRLGNLRCVLLFDTLSWPLPMAILAAASRPWHFYAAAALAGTMTAVTAGWHALFVSRVAAERRAAAYGMHAVVTNVPGLFLPLVGGWLVGQLGLELSMRWLYLSAAALMFLGSAVRWAIIPPTAPTAARMAGVFETVAEQFSLYLRTALRRDMRWLILAMVMINLDVTITGVFLPVYFMKHLGISEQDYALVPTLSCALRLATMIMVMPLVRPGNTRRFLAATGAFWATGTAILLIFLRSPVPPAFVAGLFGWPAGAAAPRAYLLTLVLAVYAIWAIGGAVYGPASMAIWMNSIPDDIRSRLWGAHGAAGQLLAAVAVAGVGHLFARWCPALLVVEIVLELAALTFFWMSPARPEAAASPG